MMASERTQIEEGPEERDEQTDAEVERLLFHPADRFIQIREPFLQGTDLRFGLGELALESKHAALPTLFGGVAGLQGDFLFGRAGHLDVR